MIQETTEFIKCIRDIYLILGKNYTPYLELNKLENEVININTIFPPRIMNDFVDDATQLDEIGKDADTSSGLNFTDDFDFTVSDRQKAYGTQLLIREISKKIQSIKDRSEVVNVVSLGIGDGGTAAQFAQLLNLGNGDTFIGLDLHEQYLEQAQNVIPGLQTIAFDLNDIAKGNPMPVQDQSADIVESAMVVHHIQDFKSLVSETSRILKRGGYFFYLDLIDKTVKEAEMSFKADHEYPSFHGVEFFRDHSKIKKIVDLYLDVCLYCRVGPGILFLAAAKHS